MSIRSEASIRPAAHAAHLGTGSSSSSSPNMSPNTCKHAAPAALLPPFLCSGTIGPCRRPERGVTSHPRLVADGAEEGVLLGEGLQLRVDSRVHLAEVGAADLVPAARVRVAPVLLLGLRTVAPLVVGLGPLLHTRPVTRRYNSQYAPSHHPHMRIFIP